MNIDRKFLRGEPTERWFRYVDGDEFEVLLRFATPAEWEAFSADRKFADIPDTEFAGFIAAHVVDWKGLHENGTPIPYTRADLDALVSQLPSFGVWLLTKLRDTVSFLSPAGACASTPAGLPGDATPALVGAA